MLSGSCPFTQVRIVSNHRITTYPISLVIPVVNPAKLLVRSNDTIFTIGPCEIFNATNVEPILSIWMEIWSIPTIFGISTFDNYPALVGLRCCVINGRSLSNVRGTITRRITFGRIIKIDRSRIDCFTNGH